MRRWLVVLGIAVVVIVAAVALAAANLNAYLNSHRGEVQERLAAELGREVSFGAVGISFRPGLGVRVEDLRVGDDAAFSEGDFVRAAAVDVGVRLVPALLGRIEVSRIVLRSPEVTLVQTAAGLSTGSLGGGAGAGSGGTATQSAGAGPAVLVSLLDIRDGVVRYVDRTAEPPVEITVEQLDVDASDLSLDEPIEFEASAALLGSERQNLEVSGVVGPVSAEFPRIELALSLDPLPLDAVAALLPAELTASGPLTVGARIEGTAAELAFTASLDAKSARLRYGEGFEKPAGVPLSLSLGGSRDESRLAIESAELRLASMHLAGTATLTNAVPPALEFQVRSELVRLRDLGAGSDQDVLRDLELSGDFTLPASGPRGRASLRSPSGKLDAASYRDLALDAALDADRIDVRKLSAKLFEGTLGATASYATGQTPPRLRADTQLAGMQVGAILAGLDAAELMSGTLEAELDLTGAGSGWEEMRPGLAGDGRIRVTDGVLRQFNPAAGALRAVAALPTTTGAGLRRFVDAHPQVFGLEDTPFETLDGRIEIRDGWVHARDFRLEAPDYVLAGAGRYSLDGELDFQTQLVFSQALSAELVEAEPYFRYARTRDGRVELPVALRGRPPKVAVVPDVARLGTTAAGQALADQLTKALGGGRGAEAPSDGDPAGEREAAQAPAPPAAEDLGRELLRQGIGGLLGGQRQEPEPE